MINPNLFHAIIIQVLIKSLCMMIYDAAMTALETMAFISNGVSLVTYFYGYMNFGLTKSATALTNFMGTAFLLSLFGGFISDTYLSRFKTCIVFGCLEILVTHPLVAAQVSLLMLTVKIKSELIK